MKRLALLPIIALLCGCSAQTLTSGRKAAKMEAEVLEIMKQLEHYERTRNAEGVLSLIHSGFYMYQDGKRIDHAAVVKQIRSTLPELRSFEPRFEDLETLALGPDTVLVSMRFHDVITDGQGKTTRMWGPTTLVWRKFGARWQMIYGDADHYPER